MHFKEMMPGLGKQYPVEIEVISKPRADYQKDEYFELNLPVAPAVMVGDEILVEGRDVAEDELTACVCRALKIVKN